MSVHVDCIIMNWHQISGSLANEIMKMNKALCVVCFMFEYCNTHTHIRLDSVIWCSLYTDIGMQRIHTDLQRWELRWLRRSGQTRCQCISKISRNLLVAKHQSVVWCQVPKPGRTVVVTVVEQASLILLTTVQAWYLRTHRRCIWQRSAYTDRQRCVIPDLTASNPLPKWFLPFP